MRHNYGLYKDGKKFGVMYADYGEASKPCSAQAKTLDGSVESFRLFGPSYKVVTDEALVSFTNHLGFYDYTVRDEGPDAAYIPTSSRDAQNWQQSYDGNRVWSFDTRPGDLSLSEIAYGLREGRFANQTRGLYTYTVLQHSVHASHLGSQEPVARMAKLLHDGHEAVLKDMPKPIRDTPGMESYNLACDARQRVINVWAGLDPDAHHMYDVKDADMTMLATERRDLMAPCEHTWLRNKRAPVEKRLSVWSQPYAVYAFLVTFRDLAKKVCPERYEEANTLLVEHIKMAREEGVHFNLDMLAAMAVLT